MKNTHSQRSCACSATICIVRPRSLFQFNRRLVGFSVNLIALAPGGRKPPVKQVLAVGKFVNVELLSRNSARFQTDSKSNCSVRRPLAPARTCLLNSCNRWEMFAQWRVGISVRSVVLNGVKLGNKGAVKVPSLAFNGATYDPQHTRGFSTLFHPMAVATGTDCGAWISAKPKQPSNPFFWCFICSHFGSFRF